MSIRIFGSGGGVITDATATPEDVKNGQVFYNNDGRQIGTIPSDLCYKQLTFTMASGTYNYSYEQLTTLSVSSSYYGYAITNSLNIITDCYTRDTCCQIYDSIYSYTVPNIPLSNIAYFILNGSKYIITKTLSDRTYYSKSIDSGSHTLVLPNYFTLKVNESIVTGIGAATDSSENGVVPTDNTLTFVYYD